VTEAEVARLIDKKQSDTGQPLTSTSAMANKHRGILLSFVSLGLLGILPIISNSRPSSLDSLTFAFYLSVWQLVCAIPFFVIEWKTERVGLADPSLDPTRHNYALKIIVITGLIFSVSTYLYVLAFEKAGTVNAAIAIQAYPLFAILIESILLSKKKQTREILLTVLLCLGLYYLATGGSWMASGVSLWFILALAVPLLWSIAHIIIKHTINQDLITPKQITFFRVLIATLFLGILASAINDQQVVFQGLFNPEFQRYAFFMGVVYYAELINWFYAVKYVDVSVASSITTPTPVITLILSLIFLHEMIFPYQLIGLVIVLISLYGLIFYERKK